MAVNVTANYRLIRSLDPLLRQSDAGRAVFVTSGAAKRFCLLGSLLGFEGSARGHGEDLCRGNAHHQSRVNLVNPGLVRTQMRAEAMPGEDPSTLPLPEVVAEALLPLLDPALTTTGANFDLRGGVFHERV